MKIYKYELKVSSGVQTIKIPAKNRILKVAAQGQSIQVWAEISEDYPLIDYTFEVFVTGENYTLEREKDRFFLDTVFVGDLVYHVFSINFEKGINSRW